MPALSKLSRERLATCDERLQRVINEAIKHVDFTILEGHRGEELQNQYFREGKSDKKWPEGAHNATPSRAVDIAPYPIDWNDTKRFIRIASFIQGIGYGLGIPIRLGGDWNNDFKLNEKLIDWPHIELAD